MQYSGDILNLPDDFFLAFIHRRFTLIYICMYICMLVYVFRENVLKKIQQQQQNKCEQKQSIIITTFNI